MSIFSKNKSINGQNYTIVETSKHKEKQVILDYMKYYGIAIEKIDRGEIMFYMIRKISDNFSNDELRRLTNNIISFFEYYIIIPPKTRQMCGYRSLDEAYSALKYLYEIMENKTLDSEF